MVGDEVKVVNIRSKIEVEKIRESGRIVYETLSAIEENILLGIDGKELDKFAENFIRSQGGEPAFKGYMGYPSSLCISINDEVVHGIPNKEPLKEGDIISIDCGAIKNDFYGDHAYTFAVGEINSETKKLLEITKESLYVGIREFKSGNRVGDVGFAIQFLKVRAEAVACIIKSPRCVGSCYHASLRFGLFHLHLVMIGLLIYF